MRLDQVLDSKGSDVATISPQDTVAELVQRLAELKIGALVVSSDGETVTGMASERDVVRHLAQDGPEIMSGPVSSIMSTKVTCSPIEASTSDLMELMTNSRVRHIPVIDSEESLIGIVSIGDVVKSRLGELQDERDALIQYVTVGG